MLIIINYNLKYLLYQYLNNSYMKDRRYNGKAIFLKFWHNAEALRYYNLTILPGRKEGLSSSSVRGVNVGVNINSKNKDAAVKALEFFYIKRFTKIIYFKKREIFWNYEFI